MKKAFDNLTAQGIPYDFHDYKKQSITENQIQAWINHLGLNIVLNKKGTTYRNLTDEQKQAITDEKTAITLMAQSPSLIKRPIVIQGDRLLIGYKETEFDTLLNS